MLSRPSCPFLLSASTARTQDVTEPSLKAAFIYTFAKFTDWPLETLPAKAVFTACVVGDNAVSDALARAVKGRQLGGRTMNVLRMAAYALRRCRRRRADRGVDRENGGG